MPTSRPSLERYPAGSRWRACKQTCVHRHPRGEATRQRRFDPRPVPSSAPDTRTVANLRSLQSSPDLRRQGPPIVHGRTGAPPDPHLRRSTDVGMPETITRRRNVTVLVNGRSRIPRAQPGRKVSMRFFLTLCDSTVTYGLSSVLARLCHTWLASVFLGD